MASPDVIHVKAQDVHPMLYEAIGNVSDMKAIRNWGGVGIGAIAGVIGEDLGSKFMAPYDMTPKAWALTLAMGVVVGSSFHGIAHMGVRQEMRALAKQMHQVGFAHRDEVKPVSELARTHPIFVVHGDKSLTFLPASKLNRFLLALQKNSLFQPPVRSRGDLRK